MFNLGKSPLEHDAHRLRPLVMERGRLTKDATATDTTISINSLPRGVTTNLGWIVIDPYTTQCELRRITGRAGKILTLSAALTYSHSRYDEIMFVDAPILNVNWFGALGDNSTDNATALQRAINNVPSTSYWTGGAIYFPSGRYNISSGLTCTTPNIMLFGNGGSGASYGIGSGASIINVDAANIVGFTWGQLGVTSFAGPVIRDLMFRDTNGTASGGIHLMGASDFELENVACSDFDGGTASYGFYLNGGTADSLTCYGSLMECRAYNCTIGIDIKTSSGVRIFSGAVDSKDNDATAYVADTIGIRLQSGSTLKIVSTAVQSCEIGVELKSGEGHTIIGPRLEAFSKGILFRNNTHRNQVIGGSFNNSASGGAGDAFSVDSGSEDNFIIAPNIAAVTNRINDAGTRTKVWDEDFYNVKWSDHSAVATVVGWGTATTKQIFYKKIGKTVDIYCRIIGTSNSATTSFSLPYVSNDDMVSEGMVRVENIGTYYAGLFGIGTNSATVTFYPSVTGGTWGTSGDKSIHGQFSYQSAG